jgi:hypothetical protein
MVIINFKGVGYMLYTASDAIDLAYRIIGKTAASYLGNPNDVQRFRTMAMDIKELYRSAVKNKIKSVEEFESLFNNFQWTFMGDENSTDFTKRINDFALNVFFKKSDVNYWIDRNHAHESLSKIYDIAVANSFEDNIEDIDWTKTVRIIESRFLIFINEKGFFFDNSLKSKIRDHIASMNESDEVSYKLKYENAIEAINEAADFCKKYEEDKKLHIFENLQREYKSLKKVLVQFEKIFVNNSRDLSYDSLKKMVDDMPDDVTKLSIEEGQMILKKVFYATYLFNHITTGKTALLNAKISLVSDRGGWSIDLTKTELFNTYIAITQPKEVIEKEIKQDKMRFNADIAEVCLRLIALSLKDITPEKFVNLEDNISYEIPNKKIVSIFMYELSQLIKYHESGGQFNTVDEDRNIENLSSDTLDNLPKQSTVGTNTATSKANRLLNFENVSGTITALKSGYREIQDYPDTVVMRTIKYIAKLGEIEVI